VTRAEQFIDIGQTAFVVNDASPEVGVAVDLGDYVEFSFKSIAIFNEKATTLVVAPKVFDKNLVDESYSDLGLSRSRVRINVTARIVVRSSVLISATTTTSSCRYLG
jgi:hypothetical protein